MSITSYILGVATVPALVAVWAGLVALESGLSPQANDAAYGCARCRRWWGRGYTSDGKWVAWAKRRWHTRTAHRQETDR